MTMVTLSIASRDTGIHRALAAFDGQTQGAHLSFASPELLWRTITPKRLALLVVLTGAGPISIREAARRVGRDVKAVHADVTALLTAGVINRSEHGVIFPYDGVHVDFTLGSVPYNTRAKPLSVETPGLEQVRLRQEHVGVERHPVDRAVGATDGDVFRERTIEVTETAEEAVVGKNTRIVEEVALRKEDGGRLKEVSETVRQTRVDMGVADPKTA